MVTMKAATVDRPGDPEVLQISIISVPKPREFEVLIQQRLAAVNYGDVIRRKRGLFPDNVPPPYVLGFEGIGTVVEVGSAVTDLAPGTRVAYLAEQGGYAEFVAVPRVQTWVVPPEITDEAAAGSTCVGVTAWGLVQQSGIRPGEAALIHGAAGGVGSILIQLLASQGVRVAALVTGSEKRVLASSLGATLAIDRSCDDVEASLRTFAPIGVDAIFDCLGQEVLALNLGMIRPGGVWLYYGSTSGHPQFPGDKILMNRLSIRGFVVFDFARSAVSWTQATAFLSAALARGTVRAQITQVLPLAEVSKAHHLLESRRAMGKLLLRL